MEFLEKLLEQEHVLQPYPTKLQYLKSHFPSDPTSNCFLQNHIQLENPIAKLILQGKFGPKDVVPVDWREGKFVFERTLQ